MRTDLKTELIDFLSSFVTQRRLTLFHQVLDGRTEHVRMILEQVPDQGDVSAVMRSCECFGVQHLDLLCNKPFKPNRGIMVGAAKWINFKAHGKQGTALPLKTRCAELSAMGYRHVVFSKSKDATPIQELDLEQPFTIIQSGDGEPSPEALDIADEQVGLPTRGFVTDFNVSIRAALLLSVIAHRLRASNIPWPLSPATRSNLELRWLLKMVEAPKLYLKRFMADRGLQGDALVGLSPALETLLQPES